MVSEWFIWLSNLSIFRVDVIPETHRAY